MRHFVGFSVLTGKTITAIAGAEPGSEEVHITCSDGTSYKMYHDQDCCESVDIEDVCGDVADIVGSPVVKAEEVEGESGDVDMSTYTWTYYKIDTAKGGITIRWYGESNGYYSESVDFVETSHFE